MPVFSGLCELFGMEQAMVNLHTNHTVIEAALAHLDDFYTAFCQHVLNSCGDQLEIFGIGDDFAGNRRLLIRPDLWRRLFRPLYAKWLGMAKARGLVTFMHSCGQMTEVLPDLIDIGLDVWQTVQTHLPGQDAALIKAEFGEHLAFVGAIDTTNVLGFATPAEVRAHVRDQIRALGAGGGYVCAPDHTVMEEVPSENVAALYDTIAEFREPGYTLLSG
jgi:uroporphyrinogen decarboxylase